MNRAATTGARVSRLCSRWPEDKKTRKTGSETAVATIAPRDYMRTTTSMLQSTPASTKPRRAGLTRQLPAR
jgi:hypothetical protein